MTRMTCVTETRKGTWRGEKCFYNVCGLILSLGLNGVFRRVELWMCVPLDRAAGCWLVGVSHFINHLHQGAGGEQGDPSFMTLVPK